MAVVLVVLPSSWGETATLTLVALLTEKEVNKDKSRQVKLEVMTDCKESHDLATNDEIKFGENLFLKSLFVLRPPIGLAKNIVFNTKNWSPLLHILKS